MSSYTDFSHLPDVEFVSRDTGEIEANIITVYEGLTGQVLYPGDPVRLFLATLAAQIAQLHVLLDHTGKMNLLRYATGPFLDHLGELLGVRRLDAHTAATVERFTIADPIGYDLLIPAGTRVTPDRKIFFATENPVVLPAGQSSVDIPVVCLARGVTGNGFVPGQIALLVDPLPVLITVTNTETSSGGTDVEDDHSYRNRIHLAPESFSVAGPELAYVFWTFSARPDIEDVKAWSPTPGVVHVHFILTGGVIPAADGREVQEVREILSGRKVRPLTDNVYVLPSDAVDLDYRFTYYLTSNQAGYAELYEKSLTNAAMEYEGWQKGKIGRDINPDELIRVCRAAGAKRIVAECILARDKNGKPTKTAPLAFEKLNGHQIVRFVGGEDRALFGGFEED